MDRDENQTGRDLVAALVGHFSPGYPVDDLPGDVLDALGRQLAADKLVRGELGAFWNLLNNCLSAAGFRPPPGGELTLLNLACGPCVEAAVLAAYFGRGCSTGGPERGQGRTRVRFYGMDLRGEEVEKAERRYAATERLFRRSGVLPALSPGDADETPEVEFFADDATRLVGYREIPSSFDIVVIRHQNVWHDRVAWRQIYGFALGRLADPGGLLVITSYFDREHLIALDLLKALGGEVVVTLRNPDSRPLDSPGKSADRHMAVVRQSPGTGVDPPIVVA